MLESRLEMKYIAVILRENSQLVIVKKLVGNEMIKIVIQLIGGI